MIPEKRKICSKCHKIVFKGHDDSDNCDCGEESYMEIVLEPTEKKEEKIPKKPS